MNNPRFIVSNYDEAYHRIKQGMQIADGDSRFTMRRQAGLGSIADTAGSAGGVIHTQPQFYSPLHTPINWQIPSKRREMMQWSRYFYENEPKVAAGIDWYAQFPMNGFTIECEDREIKEYYEKLVKKIRLQRYLCEISLDRLVIGDAFPMLQVECDKCQSSGVDPKTGGECDHEGGTFSGMTLLNPDHVEVESSPIVNDRTIKFIPDKNLINIVMTQEPRHIYDQLTPRTRALIASGQPVPLSNRMVSHIRHNPVSYATYGTSLIRRLFKILAYKDKLMVAQWIVAERLILPVRVVKVGNDDRPAGPADLADVQAQLSLTANDPNLTIVTHHAFDYEWYGTSGRVLQLTNEFEMIGKEILDGLMLNQALLNGEAASYQSAAVGVEAMIRRLDSWREELKEWIEDKIFEPVARMRGFIDEEKSKKTEDPVYIYPTVKWNDLKIRDDTQFKQMIMQLQGNGLVSQETVLEYFNINPDQEAERLRFEQAEQMASAGMALGGGMGAGFGAGAGMGGIPLGGVAPPPPIGGEAAPLGEAAPAPGAEATPGGGMPGPALAAGEGKVLKPGKAKKRQKGPLEVQHKAVKFTSIEKKMLKTLLGMDLPFEKFAQYEIPNPKGGRPFIVDYAMPQIKFAIECDGQIFHSSPEQIASDQERDRTLVGQGWTVMRFKDAEIDEQMGEVSKVILANVHKKAEYLKRKSQQK